MSDKNYTESTPLLLAHPSDEQYALDGQGPDMIGVIASYLSPKDLSNLAGTCRSLNYGVNQYRDENIYKDSTLLKDSLMKIISENLNKKLKFEQKYIKQYLEKAIEINDSFISAYMEKIKSLSLSQEQKANALLSVQKKLNALVKGTTVVKMPKIHRKLLPGNIVQLIRRGGV